MPLLPSAFTDILGMLTVDLSRLESSSPLIVSLTRVDPPFATDVSGVVAEAPADSYTAANLVQFGQPGGVAIQSVPEPLSLS